MLSVTFDILKGNRQSLSTKFEVHGGTTEKEVLLGLFEFDVFEYENGYEYGYETETMEHLMVVELLSPVDRWSCY